MNDVVEAAHAVRTLGIPIELTYERPMGSFLAGAWIHLGTVYINPDIALLGDVFHEAGHLAVTPSRFRHWWRKWGMNLDDPDSPLSHAIEERFQQDFDPDDLEIRALMQMGECEAIAWEYAAIVELGFCAEHAFSHPSRFQGQGRDVLDQLRGNGHFGINGLQAAKMTTVRTYPRMIRWLQT